ncbi:MAG TPA: apolipoprotein N-acyltransferase [Vitreimonas sp.]|uniref:apolipoprotein N-acyltransferase n=1 Tax=Vitreimonas sp. TaxID=3069702 RepID=UPI002D3F5765|nr:apolipoprotein N-acyltransferase [Vitreimonas sp.]HYD89643.1 apolipoprotein N-acyltransferase [Vitreimonas sp.]
MTASRTDASRIHAWLAARTPWQRRGIAAAAGAAATLGHAPFFFVLLFVAAIVVLIWLLDGAAEKPNRIGRGFALGWWFGLGHMTTGLYWITSAFNVDSTTWGPIWGIPATLALAMVLGLFYGVGCALAMSLWTRDLRRLPWFAACLFASEWLRGNLVFGGFPWLLPGYVWTPGEPVSQLASIVGIYGLSLLTLLMAAAVAAIADGGASAQRRFAPTIVAALLVGMGWGWGAQRLSRAPIEVPGALPVVRVADSGLTQAEKWEGRPDQEWRVLARYVRASGDPNESDASIVIWPEGAIPTVNFFQLDNANYLAAVGRAMGDRVLITGLTRCEPQPVCDAFWQGRADVSQLQLFNSAAIIDGVSGQARVSEQVYDKHKLVPGGEYIPFWSVVSALNIAPLQRIGAGFERGEAPTRLIVPDAPPAVVLICYEAIFPRMTPRGEGRPGWIVSVTNDAWFGDLRWFTGPWQHYAMARYRSIEEGLPMARAASGGVSAIVDSFGREVRSTRDGDLAIEAQLPPALVETTLARWGNILLPLLVVFIAGLRFLPAGLLARGRKS